MIYFIRSDIGPVKIGHTSKDVGKRLSGIQTGSPTALVVLGTMPGGIKKEKEIHKRFEKFRMRGEWFKGSDELLLFVKENANPYKKERNHKKKESRSQRRKTFRTLPNCANPTWTWAHNQPGYRGCRVCTGCVAYKALQIEERLISRIATRLKGNPLLVVSVLLGVDTTKTMALQKRLQLDQEIYFDYETRKNRRRAGAAGAQYYRAINEQGKYDFIIQSERRYGLVEDEIEYDFVQAIKSSKAKGKRQTGLLYTMKLTQAEQEAKDRGEPCFAIPLVGI